MSMRRTYSRVQTFPTPESEILSSLSNQFDQFSVHKLENVHQLQRSRISADHLSKILDASLVAQKMGMRPAIDAINPTTASNSDWDFLHCYLDSTVLLLDACNDIELKLESIRSCLNSILIGLHYLEGEHEPSRLVLQRVAASLDFSRLRDNLHCTKMEKIMPRMKTFVRKLSGHGLAYQDTNHESISSELYKALTGFWAMTVLAIGVLSSATTIRFLTSSNVQPPKVDPWTILFNELNNKIKVLPKKLNETPSMEELADTHLAAQALLKLMSSWQKGDSNSLRRMAVKAVAGELRRRKDELEKALPLLEKNIKELYRQIVALRINLLGLLSKAQKQDVLQMIKPSDSEESQMDANPEQYQRSVTWVKVKTKMTRRPSLPGRIRPHCIGFIKRKIVKLNF